MRVARRFGIRFCARLLTGALAMGMLGLVAMHAASADDRAMSPAGTIHSIAVETRPPNGRNAGGTRLVYRVQSASELMQSSPIPGTDDPITDGEPAIALSPLTGVPALVWTRYEQGDYEIYFSVFNGASWSPPQPLTANAFNDRKPQIFWGPSDAIHIMWAGPTGVDGAPTFYEAVLDEVGKPLVSPQRVTVLASGVISQTDSAPPTFGIADALFAYDSSSKIQIRVSAYGGYDEPIPVAKRVDMVMPAGSSPVENVRIITVRDQIVVFAKCGVKLFYAIQQSTGWTTLRIVTVDSSLTQDKAELLIRDMVQRGL